MSDRLDWYKDNPPKDGFPIPSSVFGRNVVGRNQPGFNVSIKDVFLEQTDTLIRPSEQKYNPKIIY